jgi:hypothetical protein
MDLKEYIKVKWNYWFLEIKVVPNASKTELIWLMSDWVLKIRLTSIPEKGKANMQLIDFISKSLWISKKSVEVVSWLTSKNKLVKIDL